MKVKKTPHTYLKKVFTQKNKTKRINETTNRKDYHVGEEAKVRNMSCLYHQNTHERNRTHGSEMHHEKEREEGLQK